jgi:hypothetical protein
MVIMIINLDQTYSWILNNQGIVMYSTIAALLLLLIHFLISYFSINARDRRIRRLEKEKNEIKAKFYDMQEEEEKIDKSMKSFGESLPKKDTPDDDPNQKE